MDQSKIQRRKAASIMEKGLTKTTPQVKVKKSSEMRMRNEIAKERPIGLKKGGAVRHYADGGSVKKKSEREVIEFSGKELDDIMGGASHPTKMKGEGARGRAAADVFIGQNKKGKSMDAARDAADVMMGFGWSRQKNPSTGKYDDTYNERTGLNKAKGGPVKKSDAKQDKAMLSRHNRLMHPGQASKLAKGGKPMAAGGVAKIRHGAATPSGMPKPQPRHKKNPALI